MNNEELRAGHPHPIINAQGTRHKAQVGADIIRPKEKAQQPVGDGLCALPVVRHKAQLRSMTAE